MNLFCTLKSSCLSIAFVLLSICSGYGQVDCDLDAPVITIIENTIFEGEAVEIHFTGDGPVTIILSVSFLPFNVPIVMNASPFFAPVPGVGTYEIIDSWNNTCPGIISGNPVLTVVGTINLGSDITVCSDGSTISLDAGPGYTDYSWNNGATGQTISLDPASLDIGDNAISVSATDASTGNTGYGSMNIHVLENPELTLSTYYVEMCEGGAPEKVTLTITGGAPPYVRTIIAPHYTSGPSPIVGGCVYVNGGLVETGTWVITIEDSNGCTNTKYLEVIVRPTPEGYATQDQWVCPDETDPLRFPILTAYDFDPSHTLTWTNLNDNTIVGYGNNIPVNPSVETVYQVTIMDSFGCFLEDELTIFMQVPSLCGGAAARMSNPLSSHDGNLNKVISFPNPFYDQLIVHLKSMDSGNYSLKIWDIKGTHIKTIQIGEIDDQSNFHLDINTRDWNNGNYILQLFNNDENVFSEMVSKTQF